VRKVNLIRSECNEYLIFGIFLVETKLDNFIQEMKMALPLLSHLQ